MYLGHICQSVFVNKNLFYNTLLFRFEHKSVDVRTFPFHILTLYNIVNITGKKDKTSCFCGINK